MIEGGLDYFAVVEGLSSYDKSTVELNPYAPSFITIATDISLNVSTSFKLNPLAKCFVPFGAITRNANPTSELFMSRPGACSILNPLAKCFVPQDILNPNTEPFIPLNSYVRINRVPIFIPNELVSPLDMSLNETPILNELSTPSVSHIDMDIISFHNDLDRGLNETPILNEFSTPNVSHTDIDTISFHNTFDDSDENPDLDVTPDLNEISTPNISFSNSDNVNDSLITCDSSYKDSHVSEASGNFPGYDILKDLRVENKNRILIGTLNINSLSSKIDQLVTIIGNHLDLLTIQETKLDHSFPNAQLIIDGYGEPYRLDRNKHGGGILIYVREDIPSKLLNKHKFSKNVEGLFIEINLRKTRLLFFGGYRSDHETYGISKVDFIEQMGLAIDMYWKYDKFLLAEDFNIDKQEEILVDFLDEYNLKNLVKEKTCFKSIENPSCIDLLITNSSTSFQGTTTLATGLSDFHKMVVTVLKTTFPKAQPKIIQYRSYKNFDNQNFRIDLRTKMDGTISYSEFEDIFLKTLEIHAPTKKKVVRANDKPYMTKSLRKAIMRRSYLKNKYMKYKSPDLEREYKKQRNYTNRLLKKEKKRYFYNLDISNYTDNKKFWKTIKPLFTNTGTLGQKITLIEDDEMITDDLKIAKTFNDFFSNAVSELQLNENKAIINQTDNLANQDPIQQITYKYKDHPSILEIKKNVSIESEFNFSNVSEDEMKKETEKLNPKKAGTFKNIPTKILKEMKDIVSKPLAQIWNTEIVLNKKFPSKLKLSDITPLFKKIDKTSKKNYRPINLLPVVSKIFERIMEKQIKLFMDKHLSPHISAYREAYNSQYPLATMIEKWKKCLDRNGIFGAILMDLSKAFDTINHELLVAKLKAYGFQDNALLIIRDYLSDRWHRTKINLSFSEWAKIICGVPQGSVLGPILFNIYINDLFYLFTNTHPCNYADDTTLSVCETSIENLIYKLEDDTWSAILWFDSNYMKLNNDKCHFLTNGVTPEQLFIKVGNEMIWESWSEKLLGITITNDLNFDTHLSVICKKASTKMSALARVAPLLPFFKRRLILKTFIESQFSYCPLVWMFCSRKMNRKMNYIHERSLRITYNNYTSTFQELLKMDKSITFHQRNIHTIASEMYKVKHNLCPSYVSDLFVYNDKTNKFTLPVVRSEKMGKKSWQYYGPIVWNSMIPDNIKDSVNINIFKEKIKSWVPDNCKCKLCIDFIPGVGYGIMRDNVFYPNPF